MNNDIEVVIKIPKSMKEMCKWHRDGICDLVNIEIEILAEAIKNGTVLPKSHGRLIDVNDIKKRMIPLDFSVQNWISEVELSNCQTIIETAEEVK